MNTRHVYLGRFAPLHNGHRRLINRMIEMVGVDNVLILVGSSNSVSKRTPYTFEDRKKIIEVSFPDLEVLPLPDGKPNLEYFDGSTNEIWLDSIEELAKSRDEYFVFYGGCKEDLEILAERFETKILVDRFVEGESISATTVREIIKQNDRQELEKYVEPKAINLIINKYINI